MDWGTKKPSRGVGVEKCSEAKCDGTVTSPAKLAKQVASIRLVATKTTPHLRLHVSHPLSTPVLFAGAYDRRASQKPCEGLLPEVTTLVIAVAQCTERLFLQLTPWF